MDTNHHQKSIDEEVNYFYNALEYNLKKLEIKYITVLIFSACGDMGFIRYLNHKFGTNHYDSLNNRIYV